MTLPVESEKDSCWEGAFWQKGDSPDFGPVRMLSSLPAQSAVLAQVSIQEALTMRFQIL